MADTTDTTTTSTKEEKSLLLNGKPITPTEIATLKEALSKSKTQELLEVSPNIFVTRLLD